MTIRRMLVAAAVIAASALTLPAAAGAATATITNDSGQPIPLSETAPTQIRNMSPVVTPAFTSTEKRYGIQILGPDGTTVASIGYDCIGVSYSGGENVKYLGNGTYTVLVKTSADSTDTYCAKAGAPQKFQFTIAASTSVAAPGPKLLTRKPGTTDYLSYSFGVGVNPGADDNEVRYAPNPTLNPDGGIAGDPSRASVDSAAGTANITFYDPGTYAFVSRAVDYGTNASTAWTAPIFVQVLAPFDFVLEPSFTDSHGPKYKVTGYVREKTASGKITVSMAKGRKGGKFHKVGKVRIRKGGRFVVPFTQRHRGRYRLKYTFRGSKTVAAGYVVQGIRIKRVAF